MSNNEIDWRQSIRASVDDMPERKTKAGEGALLSTHTREPLVALVNRAAAAREISVPAYVRRALQAFLALDLGIPYEEVVATDPRVARASGYGIVDETGRIFGPWEIAEFAEVEDGPQE